MVVLDRYCRGGLDLNTAYQERQVARYLGVRDQIFHGYVDLVLARRDERREQKICSPLGRPVFVFRLQRILDAAFLGSREWKAFGVFGNDFVFERDLFGLAAFIGFNSESCHLKREINKVPGKKMVFGRHERSIVALLNAGINDSQRCLRGATETMRK